MELTLMDMLRAVMTAKGWNKTKTGEELGVTQPTVSRWFQGMEPEGPTRDKIRSLYADTIAPQRLVSSFDPDEHAEAGDFDPTAHSGVSTDRLYDPTTPNASPVVDTRAGAGPGSISLPAVSPSGGVIYSEDAILGEILLPSYLQREFSPAPAGRIHWVKVRGDSMEPTLRGGDHVAVDTTDTSIAQGGMFVARNGNGEIIVKRFFFIPKSDPPMIEIRSDNVAVEPPKVVEADWVKIIGRVVAKIGRIG